MPAITVLSDNNTFVIHYDSENRHTLAEILRDNGFEVNTVCGGAGYCGKCSVNIDGTMHKSCSYIPRDDITVNIPALSASPVHSPTKYTVNTKRDANNGCTGTDRAPVSVVTDIGSTSISTAITDMSDGNVRIIDVSTIFNPTIRYGSDIISRAQASVNGKRNTMSALLRETLESEIRNLAVSNHITLSSIESIYISCNTTMQHLLLGLDCTGILSYPFTPVKFEHDRTYNGIRVCIIPSFSTFIGGDIVSGLYYLSDRKDSRYILLDLGTNAEMVLVDGDKTYCTSAAAGPAFEGAGISCGCAYVKGAVKNVSVRRRQNNNSYAISYKTIGNKLPVGICGSGILDIYSQFIENKIIDEHKSYGGHRFETGFEIAKSVNGPLSITQQDIRHVQLAVSAIKTGLDILLLRAGLAASDIERIYIAGSFGASLRPATLKNINLMPEDFFNRNIIEFAGNTSLSGAVKASADKCSYDDLSNIISSCDEIELANEPDFNTIFIGNM